MAMLAIYGPADAVGAAIGGGIGAGAGIKTAEALNFNNLQKTLITGTGATLGAYTYYQLRPEPQGKAQIPEKGEEIVGLTAGAVTSAVTFGAINFFAPAGPTVQYIAPAGAATITYSLTYELAKAAYYSLKAFSSYMESLTYALLPFLKPKKEEKKDEEKDKEKKKEEDKDKKKKEIKFKSSSWDDYVRMGISAKN